MTKLALGTHPFLLGFEQLERLVERTAKSGNEGYPPYNIEQTSENSYRITLAVAGFAEDDLAITVEDSSLFILALQSVHLAFRVFLLPAFPAPHLHRSFFFSVPVLFSLPFLFLSFFPLSLYLVCSATADLLLNSKLKSIVVYTSILVVRIGFHLAQTNLWWGCFEIFVWFW